MTIPAQTLQSVLGIMAALVYAGAVAGLGTLGVVAFLGVRGSTPVRSTLGVWGFWWLGFVMGQGILGFLWLGVSLAGVLRPWIVATLVGLGWLAFAGAVVLLRDRAPTTDSGGRWEGAEWSATRSWYALAALGIGIVCLLRGVIALLPPGSTDPLRVYLVMSSAIAASGSLEFQAFAHPFYALLPLQVELHWAALSAVSNETAVAVWDYLCALSVVLGTALLAHQLTFSRRAAAIAALIVLSTPAFYLFMGAGKTDNAAAQYGIAAFACLALLPALGRRAVILSGVLAGWALGSRYTDVILIPALVVFTMLVVRSDLVIVPAGSGGASHRRWWVGTALVGGVAVACAGLPMLIKNWLLVGCPLAPQFGCGETFWAAIYRGIHSTLNNLSVLDLVLYPFVWTFAKRANMLGNVSPLVLGLVPLLFLYRKVAVVRRASLAGQAGLVALATWLLVAPQVLHTRWLLVPLALLAPSLGASLVQLDREHPQDWLIRWSVRGAIVGVFFVLLFDARAVIHGIRYVASMDTRTARYADFPGHDIADWLNARVRAGERVALGGYTGYAHFLDPKILLQSESQSEFQWLWDHKSVRSSAERPSLPHTFNGIKAMVLSSWSADVWRFYVSHGFAYVVVAADQLETALDTWPSGAGARPDVAFEGRRDRVLRITQARHP